MMSSLLSSYSRYSSTNFRGERKGGDRESSTNNDPADAIQRRTTRTIAFAEKFGGIIVDLLRKEGIYDVQVQIKFGRKSTYYRHTLPRRIQIGMAGTPARSYAILNGQLVTIRNAPKIVQWVSTILEEVSHAVNHHEGRPDSHGSGFYSVVIRLWNKYAHYIAEELKDV